jgi:hypothetical protein
MFESPPPACAALAQSPPTADAAAHPAPAESPSNQAQSLTTWLMKHLTLNEQVLDSLQADNLLLQQERTQFYNKTEAKLHIIVEGWKERLSECQKQVIYLKCKLTKKVASLKVALNLQMKSEARVAIP